MNILIVEDDSDMQKILKLYLQREGYQVNSVSNGRDAIDFLIVKAVDIVLLDWMMPIKNGMETLKEIRQLNIPVKILMLTAKGENADEAAGLTFGADDYLRKPFDIKILLLRIKKLCNSENLLRCDDIVLNPVTMEVDVYKRQGYLWELQYRNLENSITLVKNERGKTRRCYHAWLRTTQEAADITQEQFSFYPFYP